MYDGSLRFALFCGVSNQHCIPSCTSLHWHGLSPNCCCKVLISGHVITAANVDHCWSLLIRQCVVNCLAQDVCRRPPRLPLSRIWRQVRRRTRPATRPRTAALAAAELNPVRGFPVKLLLCRLPARAPNEPSRGFHNHGEGPYKGLLIDR